MLQNRIANSSLFGVAAVLALTLSNGVAGAQTSAYYIASGDNSKTYIVQNGVLIKQFTSIASGYPIAVTNTIWLGKTDDSGATEYTLGGVATGNTSSGGNKFSQLLDGTSDGKGNNYGVQLDNPNAVTIANSNWSNQRTLFLSNTGKHFESIAYDTKNNHLFIGVSGGQLLEFDLAGNLLSTKTPESDLASLAYEQATDTLWAAPNNGNRINQYSTSGSLLQSITVSGVASFGNNFGGEFAVGPAASVPEPGSIAFLVGIASTGGLFAFKRRRANLKK